MSDMSSSRAGQQGFTLIELLVALVLIATTGFGILNWVNTCIKSLDKAKGHQERIVAMRSATAFMNTVNVSKFPSGQKELGALRVAWNSQPYTQTTGSTDANTFLVTLYRTVVKVSMRDRELEEFSMATLGVVRQGGEVDEEAEDLDRIKQQNQPSTGGFME